VRYLRNFRLVNGVVVIMLLVAGIVGVALPRLATADDDLVDIGVAPPAGYPGDEFSFYATGFKGRERVSYWFTAPDGRTYGGGDEHRVYTHKGRADWSWTVPDDAAPGYWVAVVRSKLYGNQQEIPFQVLPHGTPLPTPVPAAMPTAEHTGPPSRAPVNPPDVAVNPIVGYPGTEFSFYATGFDGHTQVKYWFNMPNNAGILSDGDFETYSFDGRADWTWKSPNTAPPGVWSVVARSRIQDDDDDDDDEVERTIYFEIRDPSIPLPDPNAAPSAGTPGSAPGGGGTGEQSPTHGLDNPPGVGVEPAVGQSDTKFAFFASGFDGQDTVYFWVIDPTGHSMEHEKGKARANEQGRADWTWKAPDHALHGVWTMVAEGEHSKVRREIQFRINNPDALPPEAESASQQDQSATAETGVEPPVGYPDMVIAFFAAGFNSRDTVYYYVVDPAGDHYEDEAYKVGTNEQGRADWTWKVPTDPLSGRWTMIAWGEHSGVERRMVFEVRNPARPDPNASSRQSPTEGTGVEPAVAYPDSRVAFFATGFNPQDTVWYWAVAPDGTSYEHNKQKTGANEMGRADWKWDVPTNAMPGRWTMIAWGEHSEIQKEMYFEVREAE
jgi:hypothetical protein